MLRAELYHHTGGDILSDSKVLQSVDWFTIIMVFLKIWYSILK